MKRLLLAWILLAVSIFPSAAQEYFDIDVDLPQYPEMQPIPDSPVYYAPQVDSNYFFYDGQYWDYYNDRWYTSAWYNGPWAYVDPVYVPTYVLWVPISYYRRPPYYFRHWRHDRPPRWGEHWGRDWQNRHKANFSGRHTTHPPRAPLPAYQRQYTRENYPRAQQQQHLIRDQHYRHQPHEQQAVRQHYERRGASVQNTQPSVQGTQPPRSDNRGSDTRGSEPPPRQSPERRTY